MVSVMEPLEFNLPELEAAAETLMSPPFAVTDEQRKLSEQLFLKLQKLKHPYQICKHILEGCQSEYVIFQAACTLKGAIVREWNMLSAEQLEELRLYLLQYTANHASLVGYAREQLVHVLAVIAKRRTLECDKKLLFDSIFGEVTQLLGMDPLKQQLGCSLLSAILVEYSSSSGSSAVGLTWEFHFHCKKAIEEEELLRILLFGMQVLEQYATVDISSLSSEAVKLLLNFVKMTSQVLNWHFCHTHPLGVAFSVAEMTNVSFKPPRNWSSTVLNPSFLQLFFKLLMGCRSHEDLLHIIFQCLSQLASLSGTVFSSDKDRTLYMTLFASELLDYIKNINFSSSNLSGQEIYGTSGVVFRLVTTFPTSAVLTMDRDKLSNFTEILAQATCMCAKKASEINSEDDNGYLYHESFDQLLSAWMHLLVESSDFPPNFFQQACCDIVQSYLCCKLAPPTGWRICSSEADNVLCDIQEDDRILYSEQLSNIGYIARTVPEYSLPLLLSLMEDCIAKFMTGYTSLVSDQAMSAHSPQFDSLYEDIHWLFLISAYLLNDIMQGEYVSIPNILMEYLINVEEQNLEEIDLQNAIVQHEKFSGRNVNMILAMLVCMCRWCQAEKLYVSAGLLSYLSPQVSSTVTWLLAKMVDSYLLFKESDYQQVSVSLSSSLGYGTSTGQWLVSFLIDIAVSNLSVWSSDQAVSESSVELLGGIAKNSAASTVAMESELLWTMMQTFVSNHAPLDQLPAIVQRKLMCNLILLASGTRKELFLTQLLEPLQQRLKFLLQRFSLKTLSKEPGVKNELLSIIECFCGVGLVSKASLVHNFIIFFQPILVSLVEVFDAFSNCQDVKVVILELFSIIADNYITFLNEVDSSHLYQVSLTLLQCYSKSSTSRFEKNTLIDEEQCEDLLLCLKLLTNLTSKEFLDFNEPTQDSTPNGVQPVDVVLYGLGFVIPLMNNELLKFPGLCEQFYTFVKFACDMYAEQLVNSRLDLYQAVFHLVKTGTVEFDSNISKLSMEAVASLASHCCSQPDTLQTPYIRESLQDYLKLLLEFMLSDSCGMDLTLSVSSTFFALVCAQQEFYTRLVESLVASQTNGDYKSRLIEAFKKLTPPTLPLSLSRRHKVQFRRNFEEFLTAVKGFMCIK